MLKDIHHKIYVLEISYKLAYDWLQNTGQEEDNKTDLNNALLSQCVHWHTFSTFMGVTPATGPLYTDKDLDKGSTNEEQVVPITTTSTVTLDTTKLESTTTPDPTTSATDDNYKDSSIVCNTADDNLPPDVSTEPSSDNVTKDTSITTPEISSQNQKKHKQPSAATATGTAAAKLSSKKEPIPKSIVEAKTQDTKKQDNFTNEMMMFTQVRLDQMEKEHSLKAKENLLMAKKFEQENQLHDVEIEKLKVDSEMGHMSI